MTIDDLYIVNYCHPSIEKQYHYIEVQVWDDECVRT